MSSDSKPFTVGITGITGRLGRLLLSALLTSRPKVHIRDALSLLALREFVSWCDVVACCYLGDNKSMTEGQKLLIDLCEEFGVKDPTKEIKAYPETKDKVKVVHLLIGRFMNALLAPFFGLWDGQDMVLRYGKRKQEV
ncbi:uncharacterized protein CTHT_0046910 [Thermochaetoides thermophila DSM 1495]|uniref:Uncharacterized protein n=1 Tax=Chaetomium thermophilum (strain DSM 1495 / CBS 144.50 / IMI 039719) TaxID=759272 RepID=G0S9R8_CHATD|nr:hypothetical protein CTHT_0046910 [Thermochaetoides thermophila DSM 1495]EGS20179.1 hypothetical protein CTHT_0046910 [Thermochaetoides thermophila DSM 1495]